MPYEQYISEEFKEVQTYAKNKARQKSLCCTKYSPYHFMEMCKENINKFYNYKIFSLSGKQITSCLETFCKTYNFLTKY